MNFKNTFILFFSLILILSCNLSDNVSIPKNFNELGGDSATVILNKIADSEWPKEAAKYISSNNNTLHERRNREIMLSYLDARAKKEANPFAQHIYYNLKSYEFVQRGKTDSAITLAYESLRIIQHLDTIKPLNTYHILGLCYYFKENKDSSLYYWQKGYELSEIEKDEKFVGLFATNLGTSYYQSGNNHAARKMFMRGIESKFRTKESKGILINNIISTLIDDSKFSEADSFWNKYKNEVKPNPADYEGQLFLLNRVNLLLQLEKKNEAQKLLNEISEANLHPTLLEDYGRVFIHNQMIHKDFSFMKDPHWNEFVLTKHLFLVSSLKQILLNNLKEPELFPLFVQLEKSANNADLPRITSKRIQMTLFEVLGNYLGIHGKAKAPFFVNEALRLQREIHAEIFEANIKTTKEFKQIERIIKEIQQKEAIIEKDQSIRNYMMIGIIMATIITFLAIGISLKNAKIKNIQKKQWEIEEMALKKEQELSSRIVEYSKIIIENNQKLKENLNRLLPMVDEKAKSEIRHMLTGAEVLTTLNTEENPGLANQLIGGDDKWEEKYPGFKHLNKTEQRVFVLVQENYKAKEIATLLGVATQYVRNVKTRLRKKLQLPDDWGM